MDNPQVQPYPHDPNAPHQRGQHPLQGYQFSPEEMRVLQECNRESFFQRSLPLGTMFGVGAYLGVKQGFLSVRINFFCFKRLKHLKFSGKSKIWSNTKSNVGSYCWLFCWKVQLPTKMC